MSGGEKKERERGTRKEWKEENLKLPIAGEKSKVHKLYQLMLDQGRVRKVENWLGQIIRNRAMPADKSQKDWGVFIISSCTFNFICHCFIIFERVKGIGRHVKLVYFYWEIFSGKKIKQKINIFHSFMILFCQLGVCGNGWTCFRNKILWKFFNFLRNLASKICQ